MSFGLFLIFMIILIIVLAIIGKVVEQHSESIELFFNRALFGLVVVVVAAIIVVALLLFFNKISH